MYATGDWVFGVLFYLVFLYKYFPFTAQENIRAQAVDDGSSAGGGEVGVRVLYNRWEGKNCASAIISWTKWYPYSINTMKIRVFRVPIR